MAYREAFERNLGVDGSICVRAEVPSERRRIALDSERWARMEGRSQGDEGNEKGRRLQGQVDQV